MSREQLILLKFTGEHVVKSDSETEEHPKDSFDCLNQYLHADKLLVQLITMGILFDSIKVYSDPSAKHSKFDRALLLRFLKQQSEQKNLKLERKASLVLPGLKQRLNLHRTEIMSSIKSSELADIFGPPREANKRKSAPARKVSSMGPKRKPTTEKVLESVLESPSKPFSVDILD